jgi:hypothetical protein
MGQDLGLHIQMCSKQWPAPGAFLWADEFPPSTHLSPPLGGGTDSLMLSRVLTLCEGEFEVRSPEPA